VTIEIGDYVLSPEICVERKSVSDLVQSLASGRLFNQAKAMTRAYKMPVLLIEVCVPMRLCALPAVCPCGCVPLWLCAYACALCVWAASASEGNVPKGDESSCANRGDGLCAHIYLPTPTSPLAPRFWVQFDGEKTISLAATSAVAAAQHDVSINQVTSKLVVLSIHFPSLRILWARDPQATVQMFAALKVCFLAPPPLFPPTSVPLLACASNECAPACMRFQRVCPCLHALPTSVPLLACASNECAPACTRFPG
jgi:hypothetical protein